MSGEAAEQDYSKLPLDERLVHKVWKARLGAYEELLNIFSKSPSEDDACFAPYLSNPSVFKKIVGDSNVVAQEAGVNTLNKFLEFAGPKACLKVRPIVIPPLAEKGLSSSRANTKASTNEALLLLVQLDTPSPVVEELTPYLKHRLPKLVAGTANAIYEIYKNFGAKTVDPKLILPHLPKLFSHADKKVRTEAINITVELYRWLGQALESILFNDLKPVHQKDLRKEFEKVKDQQPQQIRLLRSQQEELERLQAVSQAGDNNANGTDKNGDAAGGDIEMQDTNQMDAYDLVEPVDILSKLPANLPTEIKSSKWKERKEVLEVIHPLFKELKYKDDDYSDFIKIMAKCMKDVNLQVVQLAAEITEGLNKGLRSNFNKYLPIIFLPVLERTKEKKATVLDPLLSLLETMVRYSSLSTVLEDTLDVLAKTKIPKIKEEVYKFLTKCLSSTPTVPPSAEVDAIMKPCLKGITDTQSLVRNAAQETVGTLMKVVGERPFAQYMDNIDEMRQKKVREFFEKAEVKAKVSAKKAPALVRSSNHKPAMKSGHDFLDKSDPYQGSDSRGINGKTGAQPRTNGSTSTIQSKVGSRNSLTGSPRPSGDSLIKKRLTASGAQGAFGSSDASVPSKREASSPLKRNDIGRVKTGRGLTAMQINNPNNGSLMNKFENVASRGNFGGESVISSQELQELEQLRAEKKEWLKLRLDFQSSQELFAAEKKAMLHEIDSLKQRYSEMTEEAAKTRMTLKSKDTQISRLIVDYEKSQQAVQELQEKVHTVSVNKSKHLSKSLRLSGAGLGDSNGHMSSSSRLSQPVSHFSMNFDSKPGSAFHSSRSNVGSSLTSRFTVPVANSRQQQEQEHETHRHDFNGHSNHADLNTEVGKLSIEEKENSGNFHKLQAQPQLQLQQSRSRLPINGGGIGSGSSGSGVRELTQDDDWKRANEVTINLKARIEKMKSRSRKIC